ncbi:MAG: hypothetical protein U1E63_01905 [Burkholderiales bacterium]
MPSVGQREQEAAGVREMRVLVPGDDAGEDRDHQEDAGREGEQQPKPKNAAIDAHRPPSRRVAAMRLSSATAAGSATVAAATADPLAIQGKVFVIGA